MEQLVCAEKVIMLGLYPNGLRIIRDISKKLHAGIRANGRPYGVRRWMRHDATQVAVADEKYPVLLTIGIDH